MEMVLIKQGSNEWNKMWQQLADHPLNEGIDEPTLALNEGEVWQYMGSFKNDSRIIHEFRHRIHPKFSRREYFKFFGSDTISDEDIEKVLQMK